MPFIVIGIIAVISIIAIAVYRRMSGEGGIFTPGYKRAGNRGEAIAEGAIKSVLREKDRYFRNVKIEYEGKPAELDNVIVNEYGVFIIEVKNYNGYIVGKEDDYEWRKFKTTYAGNTYGKPVKNPIKQVKRQIYILAHHLERSGIKVWVRGYTILLNGNSPVESDYVLKSVDDINRVIHTPDRRTLDAGTVEKITGLL